MCFRLLLSGMCFGLSTIGVCVGLRVFERISVDVCVLRRMSVRGLSERVCVRGSDC